MIVPVCVAADMDTVPPMVEIREPNLPYPGRTSPMTPPDMRDPMEMGPMVAPKNDGGCRAIPGQTTPLFLLVLAPALLLLRRRKR